MDNALTTFQVNLQEGFLLHGVHIVGAYSHHNHAIIWKEVSPDFILPQEIRHYKQTGRAVGHFSITGWNERNYPLNELAEMFVKPIKLSGMTAMGMQNQND